jgi:phosphatidate phosphatase APP1
MPTASSRFKRPRGMESHDVLRRPAKHRWVVVSDIDDTMLETHTKSLFWLVHNTFVAHPSCVDGMPQAYRKTQGVLDRPCFWYVSASPYRLFPYLRPPVDISAFPEGQIILPNGAARLLWLLIRPSRTTHEYKREQINEIHGRHHEEFALFVGDSAQKDPEVYAEAYSLHPEWVRAIFIRTVDSCNRLEEVFACVPPNVWTTFRSASELGALVDALGTDHQSS